MENYPKIGAHDKDSSDVPNKHNQLDYFTKWLSEAKSQLQKNFARWLRLVTKKETSQFPGIAEEVSFLKDSFSLRRIVSIHETGNVQLDEFLKIDGK